MKSAAEYTVTYPNNRVHIQGWTDLEYYNKQRCADGDSVIYVARKVRGSKRYFLRVKNFTARVVH